MVRAKQITARRERNRELARLDRSHRCVVCQLDLALSPQIVEDFLVQGKCCSDACLKTLLARENEAEAGR